MSIYQITSAEIEAYCEKHSSQPTDTQKILVPATRTFAGEAARMQVGHLEGKFLTLIASLMHAKNALEFGTFTGYSALAIAEGLTLDGKITTLDRDPKATQFAKEYWQKSPLHSKIEFKLGDAKNSVLELENEIKNGTRPLYDLAFIDADKAGYPFYWESCFKLVRRGGAILVDNVLWSGKILNPKEESDFTIHNFNTSVSMDSRVEKLMIPLRDGIFLAQIK